MDQHHTNRVAEKPRTAKLTKIRFLYIFEFLVARHQLDDRGPAESHQGGGTRMKAKRPSEQVNGQAQHEAQQQKLPLGRVERQQHDEDQVDVWMDITAQTDMVDDQHLKEHERNEADNL